MNLKKSIFHDKNNVTLWKKCDKKECDMLKRMCSKECDMMKSTCRKRKSYDERNGPTKECIMLKRKWRKKRCQDECDEKQCTLTKKCSDTKYAMIKRMSRKRMCNDEKNVLKWMCHDVQKILCRQKRCVLLKSVCLRMCHDEKNVQRWNEWAGKEYTGKMCHLEKYVPKKNVPKTNCLKESTEIECHIMKWMNVARNINKVTTWKS